MVPKTRSVFGIEASDNERFARLVRRRWLVWTRLCYWLSLSTHVFDATREMLFFSVNLARSIIGWYFSAMSNIQLAFNFCLLT